MAVLLVGIPLSACHGSSPATPVTTASVAVTGTVPSVGQTSQLTATATLSNSTTTDVTAQATWSSSDTTIATVTAAGVLTVVTAVPASATIAASYQNVSGQFSVITQAVRSISLTGPTTLTIPQSVQFTATANFSNGTSQDVTDLATWGPVGGPGEPWFSAAAGGVVTPLQTLQSGSTIPFPRITASYNGGIGTATVTVALPCQFSAVTGSLPGVTALTPTFLRISPPSTGGAYGVTVQGPSDCAWETVAVDASTGNTVVPSAFATVTAGGSGAGNGVISFSIGANFPNGALRIIPVGAGSNSLNVSPFGVVEWFTN